MEQIENKSADGVLRTISDTGKCKLSGSDINAQKSLFLATTNERVKELHKKFGLDVTKAGRSQCLKLIEFEDLDIDSCKKIALDIINKVKNEVTNFDGTAMKNECMKLNNGVQILKLGLGTWLIDDNLVAKAVKDAVKIGYHHIDTAQAYENENGVGEGIVSCGISKHEIFVTSKVIAENKPYN